MRHDEERPASEDFDAGAPVPGHWIEVLASMRANPFTRLSRDEVRTAPHLLIVSPSPEVTAACCSELLEAVPASAASAITPEDLDDSGCADIPAGAWVLLPHRHDGWTRVEAASARLRSRLVQENTGRTGTDKLTLIEYGINLWLWAEPPSSGGDPVCHAGELISWESAWALQIPDPATARPPIYFGLPDILRQRRSLG